MSIRSLTRISAADIEMLSAQQLPELLEQLLYCEQKDARGRYYVQAQITVPDGGQDGCWIGEAPEGLEFIPKTHCVYQCKAQSLSVRQFHKELISSKGKLKRAVKDVLERGGAYILMCNHSVDLLIGDKFMDSAQGYFSEQGISIDIHPESCICVFDCNKIAQWVNRHPACQIYVQRVKGIPSDGPFSRVKEWGRVFSGDYHSNQYLQDYLAQIKSDGFVKGGYPIRVTGQSGLGKSRLVYEAVSSHPVLKASSLYVDCHENEANIRPWIAGLVECNYYHCIILDNCPAHFHLECAELAAGSSISFISISHDVEHEPDMSTSCQCIKLDNHHFHDITKMILMEDIGLSAQGEDSSSLNQLVAYVDGYPLLAQLVVKRHLALSVNDLMTSRQFFEKLLGGGDVKIDPHGSLMRVAEALSLVSVWGGSSSRLEAELKDIRSIVCPNLDGAEFHRMIKVLKDRQILQKKSDTLRIVPKPVSIALMSQFLSCLEESTDLLEEFLRKMEAKGLLDRMLAQLAYLERSPIVEELCLRFHDRLPFHNAEYLLSGQSYPLKIFRVFCKLSPETAVVIVRDILIPLPLERLCHLTDERRILVPALEWLAWKQEYFADSARMLFRLAVTETEHWTNNATGLLQQLYHLYLSGTQCPASERLSVLWEMMDSPDIEMQKIAVQVVGAALSGAPYSRCGDESFWGTRQAKDDWRPRQPGDVQAYWKPLFLRLIQMLPDSLEIGVTSVFLRHWTSLVRGDLLSDEEITRALFDLHGRMNGVWPELKIAIHEYLRYHQDIAGHIRNELQNWIVRFSPDEQDWLSRIKEKVTSPGWKQLDELEPPIKELAREMVEAQGAFDDRILQHLIFVSQQQGYTFGMALGQIHPNPLVVIEACLSLWESGEGEKYSSFLLGLLTPLRQHQSEALRPVMRRIEASERLRELFVPILSIAPTEEEVRKVCHLIAAGCLNHSELEHFIRGVPLASFDAEFLINEFDVLLHKCPESAISLAHVLYYIVGDREEGVPTFADLLCRLLTLVLEWKQLDWMASELAKRILYHCAYGEWSLRWLQLIYQSLENEMDYQQEELYLKLAFAIQERYRDKPAIWSPFLSSYVSKNVHVRWCVAQANPDFDFESSGHGCFLWQIPAEIRQNWLNEHRDMIAFILRHSLLSHENDGCKQWLPQALQTIEVFPDDADKLADALWSNLCSFGSMGSRVPYMESRLQLVRQLQSSNIPKIKEAGRKLEDLCQRELARIKRAEENEQLLE
ncbi:hypothetical protein ICN84_06860 [Akkermansia glycaniphila]|uniref:hypothetical protein n=1 Tax=Akkermansia glycaniphila TaxID=1679444 RepID=UPI001C036F6E|nr:hypothetical protein [Akkermansia glycaniphila]MBT9449795.1 hypothetical protein [Akkermansia glycaniphila]